MPDECAEHRPLDDPAAAGVGLSLWGRRASTTGWKIMVSTAANVSGNMISFTAPSASTTMIVAATNPTKLQAKTPSVGTQLTSAGPPLRFAERPVLESRRGLPADWSATVAGPRNLSTTSGLVLRRSSIGETSLEKTRAATGAAQTLLRLIESEERNRHIPQIE